MTSRRSRSVGSRGWLVFFAVIGVGSVCAPQLWAHDSDEAQGRRAATLELGAEYVDFSKTFTFRTASGSFLPVGDGLGVTAGVGLALWKHWVVRLGGAAGQTDLGTGSATYVSLEGEMQYVWTGPRWQPFVALGIGGVLVDSDTAEIPTNHILAIGTIRQRLGARIPVSRRVRILPSVSHRFTGDFFVDNGVEEKAGTLDLALAASWSF